MPPTLVKRLEQVTAEQRRQRATRRQHDLAMFSDDELEELCELAQKADDASRTGQPVDWTAEELGMLEHLDAKQAAQRRW